MIFRFTKKKGRLTTFGLLLGLAIIVVFMSTRLCTVCSICTSHCTSCANYMFQSAFGHNERQSETMTKSTEPCEAKDSSH